MQQHHDVWVFVLEHDIFSRHCIAGCLGWDRRTHVAGQAASSEELEALIATVGRPPRIDAILLDCGLASDPAELEQVIRVCRMQIPAAKVICLAESADAHLALAAAQAGSCAFLVREKVGLAIASALCIALERPFTVTHDLAAAVNNGYVWPCPVHFLPERRQHDDMPKRVIQALDLCVLDGMPAEVAADEMGISPNTVRSYVKEGYRILEAEDGHHYPWTLSPMERAFLRITTIEEDQDNPSLPPESERAA